MAPPWGAGRDPRCPQPRFEGVVCAASKPTSSRTLPLPVAHALCRLKGAECPQSTKRGSWVPGCGGDACWLCPGLLPGFATQLSPKPRKRGGASAETPQGRQANGAPVVARTWVQAQGWGREGTCQGQSSPWDTGSGSPGARCPLPTVRQMFAGAVDREVR